MWIFSACYTLSMLLFTAKKILGILCLAIGLFALVTPLTPGSWLIFVGIELLGLTFLLPRRIREPWEKLKAKLLLRLRRFRAKRS
jgi:hypothetical protein